MFFCAHIMMSPPLNLQNNPKAALGPYPYVTNVSTATEDLLLYVTTKCLIIFSTLFDKPPPLTIYTVKP